MKYISGVLLVAIFSTTVLYPQEAGTLFFPGLFEYEHQAACYTKDALKTPRGSLSLSRKHASLFSGDDVSVCKFSEIVDPTSTDQVPLASNPIIATCLAPLSWLSRTAFYSFWERYRTKTGRVFSGTSHSYEIDLVRTNIAGPGDIAAAVKFLQEAKRNKKENKQLVFGASRGSTAAFIALSKIKDYNPTCAIFESPFAEFNDTLPESPWLKRAFFKGLYTLLPKHDKAALQFVDQFPKDVPVLFVTSANDEKVPLSSVKKLAYALASSGHDNIHLLKLSESTHKGYAWENQDDRDLYEKVAGAFLDKYQYGSVIGSSSVNLDEYRVKSKNQ